MSFESSEDRLPILATAVTPWTSGGEFAGDVFCRGVRAIARGLTRRIYISGTAGEGHAVSDRQSREVAAAVKESEIDGYQQGENREDDPS